MRWVAVARGELFVDAELASRVGLLLGSRTTPGPDMDGLSARELEVLSLVGQGPSNAAVRYRPEPTLTGDTQQPPSRPRARRRTLQS